MILVGNQRGGASNLATHLMKEENEHIEVHELRGFTSDNLKGALTEAYAMSRATRCRQYLFSLSLNPPPNERVPTQAFEDAITRVEERLGLTGQPRAIVFHEKEGRRHAHAVWSRIDAEKMKAIPLSFSHRKMMEVARELHIEHGWNMPRGLVTSQERNPKNFTLEEWQQAKRIGKDPRAIKADFQDSWAISDSRAAFVQALKARGYRIARGDRAAIVAVDVNGEVHSIAKQVGIKTKQARERLGNGSDLPSVPEAKAQIAREMIPSLLRLKEQAEEKARQQRAEFEEHRKALVAKQQTERTALENAHAKRQLEEATQRQERFRSGLKGLWDRLRGERSRIEDQNQRDAYATLLRDRAEKDDLIFHQLTQRQNLGEALKQERERSIEQGRELKADVRQYQAEAQKPQSAVEQRAQRLEEFKQQRQQQQEAIPAQKHERGRSLER